jgi:hypothetical protein
VEVRSIISASLRYADEECRPAALQVIPEEVKASWYARSVCRLPKTPSRSQSLVHLS